MELLSQEPFDVVIVDVYMPHCSGVEVAFEQPVRRTPIPRRSSSPAAPRSRPQLRLYGWASTTS